MEEEVIIMDNGKPFVPKAELRTFAPTLLLAVNIFDNNFWGISGSR
jgi:hypothetical protein